MHRLPVVSSLHPAGTFARVDNNVFGRKSEIIKLTQKSRSWYLTLLILLSLQLFIANLCIATNNLDCCSSIRKTVKLSVWKKPSVLLHYVWEPTWEESESCIESKSYCAVLYLKHFVHYGISSPPLAFEICNTVFRKARLSPQRISR